MLSTVSEPAFNQQLALPKRRPEHGKAKEIYVCFRFVVILTSG